ncbi:SDR family oxidoreductase [Vulgatibacter incomptus]|uniref:Sorbitol-6-phosphate 2-dehydrogenase n=1 Tax=Vulgatibacter incomptus TaxID=1391653 RepID=A0A0K1P946_9BACT|nr:SDR family oxidoreductase [Vulgatibacter incomptus]AKU89941.1 Sorbitol-6-phosphate 2-dehydrogenase [Vulgatibacter incomptus]
MRRIVIFGATSAIAQETARLFASKGARLFLVGRNAERLEAVASDLRVRGASQVEHEVFDLDHIDGHGGLIDRAEERLGGLDTALVAHGTLPDQAACASDFTVAEAALRTNFVSAASLLTHLANRFEARRYGAIAVISSVAGDRGRQSNYVYGSAKAALTAFASGMRNRLHAAGVSLVTVKPGFVDTPMTAHVPKGPLFVGPAVVGKGIYRAIMRGRGEVYLPRFWWAIMAIIRSIPEAIFVRLKL